MDWHFNKVISYDLLTCQKWGEGTCAKSKVLGHQLKLLSHQKRRTEGNS